MGWLAIVKAVLPHAGTIVDLAGPVFTKLKNREQAAAQPDLVQQQIEELQSAAAQNAEHIRDLALQLQDTVKALEQAMLTAEARIRRMKIFCYSTLGIALLSLAAALSALSGR